MIFAHLLHELRRGGIPTALSEYLVLLEAVSKGLHGMSVETFYALARSMLVKDERHLDNFDTIFARVFSATAAVPDEAQFGPQPMATARWLEALAERSLQPEELHALSALGLKPLGPTSPQDHAFLRRLREVAGTRADSVIESEDAGWARHDADAVSGNALLSQRNLHMALRQLRRFSRRTDSEELDIEGTVLATAENAGFTKLVFQSEVRQSLSLLLFLDIGSEMEAYLPLCQDLFEAARIEFKRLELFYYRDVPAPVLWRGDRRRWGREPGGETPFSSIVNNYNDSYRAMTVGRARGLSGDLPAQQRLRGLRAAFPNLVWFVPDASGAVPEDRDIESLRAVLPNRVFPFTSFGLEEGIRVLGKG